MSYGIVRMEKRNNEYIVDVCQSHEHLLGNGSDRSVLCELTNSNHEVKKDQRRKKSTGKRHFKEGIYHAYHVIMCA